MKEIVVDVKNVSMRFNLAEQKVDSVKEYLLKIVKKDLRFNEFYALKDISFQIEKGDAVALMGMNGSGKSTLLKVIAGVLYPTVGTVSVRGSIAPLIELGAGFDMELTARENVFLNGAVLGISRKEMESHMDQIVEFSELQDFMDVPLKNYSSGMRARLGFAIATIISADILIVDEVLSVGDARFKKKSKNRMMELMGGGTTVLFVSHDSGIVRSLCTKAIWLDHGKIVAQGNVDEICDKYESFIKND